jgi:hypothetical protein
VCVCVCGGGGGERMEKEVCYRKYCVVKGPGGGQLLEYFHPAGSTRYPLYPLL